MASRFSRPPMAIWYPSAGRTAVIEIQHRRAPHRHASHPRRNVPARIGPLDMREICHLSPSKIVDQRVPIEVPSLPPVRRVRHNAVPSELARP